MKILAVMLVILSCPFSPAGEKLGKDEFDLVRIKKLEKRVDDLEKRVSGPHACICGCVETGACLCKNCSTGCNFVGGKPMLDGTHPCTCGCEQTGKCQCLNCDVGCGFVKVKKEPCGCSVGKPCTCEKCNPKACSCSVCDENGCRKCACKPKAKKECNSPKCSCGCHAGKPCKCKPGRIKLPGKGFKWNAKAKKWIKVKFATRSQPSFSSPVFRGSGC